jgi:hypothetical protein
MAETPNNAPQQPVMPGPVTPANKSSGGGMLMAAAAIVAVGGIAFAGGRLTAPAASAASNGTNTGLPGANGYGFPGRDGSFAPNGSFAPGAGGLGTSTESSITGTVESIDGDKITLKTASGTTLTITTSSTTTYHGQTSATSSDVTVGSSVIVSATGFGFRGGQPGAQASAGASPAASATTQSITAKDITLQAK